MEYGKESIRKWNKERLLNLIINSHYGLFADPLNVPKGYKVRKWLNKYLKRETFRNKLKEKQNEENS